MGQRNGAALAGLFLFRRGDPDIVRNFPRNVFQHSKARRVDAVIIGQQDSHAEITSRPPM